MLVVTNKFLCPGYIGSHYRLIGSRPYREILLYICAVYVSRKINNFSWKTFLKTWTLCPFLVLSSEKLKNVVRVWEKCIAGVAFYRGPKLPSDDENFAQNFDGLGRYDWRLRPGYPLPLKASTGTHDCRLFPSLLLCLLEFHNKPDGLAAVSTGYPGPPLQ